MVTSLQITNWYLYGQSSTPIDKTAGDIIRDADVTTDVGVNLQNFMDNGAGRQFELIQDFFTADSSLFELNREYTN